MSYAKKFSGKKRAKVEVDSSVSLKKKDKDELDYEALFEGIRTDLREVRNFLNQNMCEFYRFRKLVHEDEGIMAILQTDEDSDATKKAQEVHDLIMENFECCEEEHEADTIKINALLNKYFDEETGELVNNEKEEPPLANWTFKFNENTENSYILFPTVFKNIIMAEHKVSFDNFKGKREEKPVAWDIFREEIDRPVFYSAKYGGWIVSLRLYKLLLAWGATADKPCYDESDDE
jgi:hypothetical protein